MPSIARGNTLLLETGINTMSSTTPMRKSRRMKTQPSSETHRYSAFKSATATADPQTTPSSARLPGAKQDLPISGSRMPEQSVNLALSHAFKQRAEELLVPLEGVRRIGGNA